MHPLGPVILPGMSRRKSFQTAAARRRNDPLIYEIDGHEITLVATVDLATLAPLIQTLADGADDADFGAAVQKRDESLRLMRVFVEPGSMAAFDAVADDLALGEIVTLVQEWIGEFTGADPTPPAA